MTKHHAHHYHKQKTYAAIKKKKGNDAVDYFVYFFMFISPLFEVPQAVTIYTQKSADQVSFATWTLFFLASIAWLIYGIRHKLKLIIAVQIAYMVIEGFVVIGLILYA